MLFYFAVCSMILLYLDFVHGDLALTGFNSYHQHLTSTGLEHFESARRQDSATCARLAHGCDSSYCTTSMQKQQEELSYCLY